MDKASLLIIAQSNELIKSYKLLLGKYVHIIGDVLINDKKDFENIDFTVYDLVVVDIVSKKFLDYIDLLKGSKSKVVLVTPYNLVTISNNTSFLEFVHLTLTKPLDVGKLVSFIKNESTKINKRYILEKKNHILAKVVDLHPSRIGVYDIQGILIYANNHYLDANNLNMTDIDRLAFDDISECNIGFFNIKEKLEISKQFTVQRQEGEIWYESIFYIIDNDFVIHICTDITIQKQKEIQLEQAAVFFENSNEGIVITDSRGIIKSVNKAFSKITGFAKSEVIGKTPAVLNSGIHDKIFYEHMWDSLKNNNAWQGEIWNRRRNGEIYPEWLSISKALNPKYNEEFYIAIFADITNLKDADKKLYYYANHDLLTGLANRVQFESHLKHSIASAKRNNTKLALFFVDLDKFKDINDTYGHSVGDIMLQSIAKRIERTLRAEDFVARIGGDEFVLVLKDFKNSDDMILLAQKLIDAIKEPLKIDDKVFFMTLSIGISIYPDDGEDSEDLIKHADSAMYVVKENGRNGFMLYHKDMSDKLSQKVTTQNQLKVALSQDQFEMYYQSIIDIKTNRIIGAEALVRWNHPKKGVLTPPLFLDYIDDSSMALEFGDLVIKKVFHDMQTINSTLANPAFKVSINISPKQFYEETFVKKMVEVANDFGIKPTHIEIELLETSLMNSHVIAEQRFQELKTHGFSIAIDDFGTGYSSLSYLKNFKVDKLKIDQSFIRDFLEDNNDKAIVEAIIKLADTFGLIVQAEGVETLEHQDILKQLNCQLAQGYYYNKPLTLAEFIDFVKGHK